MKKNQLRKIVILLVLSATPRVYAVDLSATPSRVPNAVRLDITFTNSTGITNIGFSSTSEQDCSAEITDNYFGGAPFALGAAPTRAAFFNGHLPRIAATLCVATTGTIALDGVITDQGACPSVAGCYSYTCDQIGGVITGMTPVTPFTATCP